MSREAIGQISVKTLADGTRASQLRFRVDGRRERRTLHERRDCERGCAGGWTRRTAAVELGTILAKVKAGVWRRPRSPEPPAPNEVPTFHRTRRTGSSQSGKAASATARST